MNIKSCLKKMLDSFREGEVIVRPGEIGVKIKRASNDRSKTKNTDGSDNPDSPHSVGDSEDLPSR